MQPWEGRGVDPSLPPDGLPGGLDELEDSGSFSNVTSDPLPRARRAPRARAKANTKWGNPT